MHGKISIYVSYALVTAVSGNNLTKEINERWHCQWEMIPNHLCVIQDKNRIGHEQ